MLFRTQLAALLMLVLFSATIVHALFEDDAFVVDWHIESTGSLTSDRTLISADSIAVFSEASVLASLNPTNGSVRWRHLLADNALAAHSRFTRLDSAALLLAGATPKDQSISYVSTWIEESGYLLWEAYLPHGAPVGVAVLGDVYVFLSSGKVVRLDKRTGVVKWEFILDDGHSPVDIFATSHGIALLTRVQEKGLGYLLLDSKSGELVDTKFRILDKNPAAVSILKVPGAAKDLVSWTVPGESSVVQLAMITGTEFVPFTFKTKSAYASFALSATSTKLVANVVGEDGSSWVETYLFDADKLLESSITNSADFYTTSDSDIFAISSSKLTKYTASTKLIETSISLPPSNAVFMTCAVDSCIVALANGEYVFISLDGTTWTRDESTSETVAAVFVDLEMTGESAAINEILFEEHAPLLQAYIHRVKRHWKSLGSLPQFFVGFGHRFLSGDYEAVPILANSTVTDTFGLRKFIILATARGGLRALDTVHGGAVAWKMDQVLKTDVIAGIVPGGSKDEMYVVGAFGTLARINPLTGAILTVEKIGELGLGDKIESVSSFIIDKIKYIAAWTAHSELHFLSGPAPAKPIYFSKVVDDTVQGFVYTKAKLIPTWLFSLPTEDYEITSVGVRHPEDQTVSLGRVLGDRSVLYKYLNPHVMAITAVNPETQSAAIFIIDNVSGRLLYSAFHDDEVIDTAAGVKVAVGENFVVYSYWSELAARGEKVVVLDLYESDIKNDRWSNASYSAFDDTPLPYVQAQAYLFPHHITSLAISRTRFGITNRDIIATLDTAQVASIPKRLLDARRPVDRDPSAEEKEEMLMRYDPFVVDDRRAILSHVRQVLGVKTTLCAPAYLESTVLVFTYGLDLFFTRITPSQPFDILPKSFNRGQLLLTILALIIGVRVAAPMVQWKQINARWGKQN
ncbi:hypothetical protein V1512DRAFT_277409 [Lipomyces arxii]|uniref:uncharacterized protein n=1 Tax=Lipomyces arxii TaxID=56418 RepID=UPI0034CED3CF